MKKVIIVYGSSTDNTKSIAKNIANKLQEEDVKLIDVIQLKEGDLDAYPNIILGSSTWGVGDLQDDWEGKISILSKANLNGKTVAFFGTGDSSSYSDSFADAMGILYETVKDKGCRHIGAVSTDGYNFDASKAVVEDKFVGVAIDEDNESNMTESRIDAWIADIRPQLL